jgi:hypothetical protein
MQASGIHSIFFFLCASSPICNLNILMLHAYKISGHICFMRQILQQHIVFLTFMIILYCWLIPGTTLLIFLHQVAVLGLRRT